MTVTTSSGMCDRISHIGHYLLEMNKSDSTVTDKINVMFDL